jgi:hypothetical protein
MKSLHKRIGISTAGMIAVGGMAAMGFGATHAEFTSSTGAQSPTYTLTAGTVHISGSESDSSGAAAAAAYLEPNLAPGDVTTHTFNVTYNGTLNAWMGVDTLLVSTIDNSAPPTYGKSPEDFKYRVLDGIGTDWQKQQISENGTGTSNEVHEMTACPATFDGVTVPSTLSVTNPTTAAVSQAPTFCYLAETYVDPFWTSATNESSLTETTSGDGSQTEIGAWPAGNKTPETQPLTIEFGLCDGNTLNATGGLLPDATHATCPTSVPNSYQGQTEEMIVGAHAVAARNNSNTTNNGPLNSVANGTKIDGGLPAGLTPTYPPTPPPANVNWG